MPYWSEKLGKITTRVMSDDLAKVETKVFWTFEQNGKTDKIKENDTWNLSYGTNWVWLMKTDKFWSIFTLT